MSQHKPDRVEVAASETDAATIEAPNAEQQDERQASLRVTELQAQLEQAQQKAEDNWNQYLQARAEIDNIRKRAERDLQNAHKFALDKFVAELLPVKDSLEMGLAVINESADVAALQEGTELTLKKLSAAVAKFGVTEVNPQGEKFNPELHEAMAMQPSSEAEPNTVLQVIQKGYRLHERLVRPAMVIVAQAAPKPADKPRAEKPD